MAFFLSPLEAKWCYKMNELTPSMRVQNALGQSEQVKLPTDRPLEVLRDPGRTRLIFYPFGLFQAGSKVLSSPVNSSQSLSSF